MTASNGTVPENYRMRTSQIVRIMRFHLAASKTADDPAKLTVPASLLALAADRLERFEADAGVERRKHKRQHEWKRSRLFAVDVCHVCGHVRRKGVRNIGCTGRPESKLASERVAKLAESHP